MKRINNVTLVFLLIIFTIVKLNAQDINKKMIGCWKSYKELTTDGDDGSQSTFSNKPYSPEIKIEIINEKKLNFTIFDDVFLNLNYEIKNNTLLFGNFWKYKIIFISDSKLILQEEHTLLKHYFFFKKINNSEE